MSPSDILGGGAAVLIGAVAVIFMAYVLWRIFKERNGR